MSFLIIVLIGTGIVIWNRYFETLVSMPTRRLAVFAHSMAAVLIICVWILHVYASIWIRGTMRAMIRGSVTGGWAWRHHRRWLRELVAGKRFTPPPSKAAE